MFFRVNKSYVTPQDTDFARNQKTSSIGDKVIEISKPVLKIPKD